MKNKGSLGATAFSLAVFPLPNSIYRTLLKKETIIVFSQDYITNARSYWFCKFKCYAAVDKSLHHVYVHILFDILII